MRIVTKAPLLAGCALLVAGGCDSVDVGRLPDDPGPPRLVRILVQDEDFSGAGRGLITDLLNTAPDLACDEVNVCPAALRVSCSIADGETAGLCVDPTKPFNTPASVGLPVELGGTQLRLVFSKLLALELPAAVEGPDGASIARLSTADGDVPVVRYFDPAGSPTETTDPVYLEPYGPALVLKPEAPLTAATTYTLTIDPAKLVDRAGQALASDPAGPIRTTYTFTTEALYPVAASPDVLTSTSAAIAPNTVIQLELNAAAVEAGAAVEVRDASGAPVATLVWLDRADAEDCEGSLSPRLLDVVRLSVTGAPEPWAPGAYTINYGGVRAAGSPEGRLSSDAFGTAAFTTGFVVEGEPTDPAEDPSAVENFVLPGQCAGG
jgi:hypothetical protein